MAKTPDASTAPKGRLAKLLNDRSRREKQLKKELKGQ